MAAAADAIITIKDLYGIGKEVYDRCQTVRNDFNESRERLSERLKVITANLKSYEDLENEGKIRFQEEWSSDLTPVGTAAFYGRQHLNSANRFLGKLDKRRSFDKFVNKADIESRFNTLAEDLRDAGIALSNAVQPLTIPGGQPKQASQSTRLNCLQESMEKLIISKGSSSLKTTHVEDKRRGHVAVKEFYDRVKESPPSSPIPVISASDLTEIRNLGNGRYGRVYMAKHIHMGHVAVEQFYDQNSIKQVLREVKKMFEGIECKYLVDILGYIDEPNNVGIVMELCVHGNLHEFNRKFMMGDAVVMARKIRMILDIAEGMQYLHSRPTPIFHSDLKLQNVFVGEDFSVKIGDFGFAVSMVTSALREVGGTISHVPPEAYANLAEAAVDEWWDIFTFGITLFEFLSGNEPWPGLQSGVIIAKITKGKRPDTKDIPPSVPKDVVKMMKKCWDAKPKKRPLFGAIVSSITNIYRDFERTLENSDEELDWLTSLDKLSDKLEVSSTSDLDFDVKFKVVAQRDYEKKGEVDFSFKEGDVIDVIQKTTPDWWIAKFENVKRFIASSLVAEVDVGKWEKVFVIRDTRLKNPSAIALTDTGLAVTDKNVLVFKKNGTFSFALDDKPDLADSTDQIHFPSGVAFSSGKMYVTDSKSSYVRHYSADDGKCCGKWPAVDTKGKSAEDAELKGICAYDICILVGECMNKYVSTHYRNGTHVRSFKVDIPPVYLATTEENVIVSDSNCRRIQLVTGEGQLLREIQHPEIGNPLGVCYCNRIIYVCDSREPKLFCFTQYGTYITSIAIESKEPGDGWGGSDYVAIDEGATTLFVARGDMFDEPSTGRVEVYTRIHSDKMGPSIPPSSLRPALSLGNMLRDSLTSVSNVFS